MLEAKEKEYELKMQEKEKWLQEQKKLDCTRMRRMTQKIQAKLKPAQAELFARV